MKEGILMRVLFCKIHCPFICFCKPSAAHLYSPGPLKLENTRQESLTAAVSCASDRLSGETIEVKEEHVNGKQDIEDTYRSCIKKPPVGADGSKEATKKRVQWMDNIGKQLAEIKEIESSDTGDTDNEEENSRCLCIIL